MKTVEQPERLNVVDGNGRQLWVRAPVRSQRWGHGCVRGAYQGDTIAVFFYLPCTVELVEASTVTVTP